MADDPQITQIAQIVFIDMSAFVALTIEFSGAPLSVVACVQSCKTAGWLLASKGNIMYLVDRTDDWAYQMASSALESEILARLESELASGAKAGIVLYAPDQPDYQVWLTFTAPLSVMAIITADRVVFDIGGEQELTDMTWYIQHFVQPLCVAQPETQLHSLKWSEMP